MLFENGRTCLAGNNFTWCPMACKVLAQWCAPPQASMATSDGWRLAKKTLTLSRLSLCRLISPVSPSTTWSWNTFLAISIPITGKFAVDFMSGPPVLKWLRLTSTLAHRCRRREAPPVHGSWPFACISAVGGDVHAICKTHRGDLILSQMRSAALAFLACSTRYSLQNPACIPHLGTARSSLMSFAEAP